MGNMILQVWICLPLLVHVSGRQVLSGTTVDKNVNKESVHYLRKGKEIAVSTTTSTGKPSTEAEKWVVDSIYYDQYQSDSTGTGNPIPDFCPPIPDVATDEACALNPCKSDADCSESQRCCYNGCTYTCLLEIKPAPVLDWLVEPRRLRSGISWLIDGPPSSRTDAEVCSIAPVGRDEDPLLCPHGYFCYIEDSKKKNGKPQTRGVCVKEAQKGSMEKEESALTSSLEGRKFCTVDNVVLLEGAKIRLVDKHCRCKKGFLSCARYKTSGKQGAVKVKKTKKSRNKSRNKTKDNSNALKRRKRKRNKSKKKNVTS